MNETKQGDLKMWHAKGIGGRKPGKVIKKWKPKIKKKKKNYKNIFGKKKVKQLGVKEKSKKTFPTINAYTVSHLCDIYITTRFLFHFFFFKFAVNFVYEV